MNTRRIQRIWGKAFTEEQVCGWEVLMCNEEGEDEMNSDKKNDRKNNRLTQ